MITAQVLHVSTSDMPAMFHDDIKDGKIKVENVQENMFYSDVQNQFQKADLVIFHCYLGSEKKYKVLKSRFA